MPDIHGLLDAAAGEPVAGLDLPAVLRRADQRRRRRRTGTAVAAVAPLALLAAGFLMLHDRPETLVPAGPAPSASSVPTTAATPLPTTGPEPLADGVSYGFLTAVDATGDGVTFDKADFLGAGCLAAVPRPTRTGALAACYRNVNPALRHLTLRPDATVVLRDSSGEPLPADVAALRKEVSGLTAAQLRVRPWRLTVSGGTVVAVTGEVYESA